MSNDTYDNTNRGAAFPNDKKTTSRHPDFRGTINADGKEYFVSVWVKIAGPAAKNPGQKFLSMSLTPIEQEASGDPLEGYGTTEEPLQDKKFPEPEFPNEDPEDDIPF